MAVSTVGKGTLSLAKSFMDDALNAVKNLSGKAAKEVKEGVYEFVDSTGKPYVGQTKDIPRRIKDHIKSGKLPEGTKVKTTEVKGGKTAREIAEHKRIQELTGGDPARRSPDVSSLRDPVGPARRHLLE